MTHNRVGDYSFQTVIDSFEPRLDELRPWLPKLGLSQQTVYFYGGFTDADGNRYAVERKFTGPMTAGVWLMSDRGGEQLLDPGTVRSTRGEVRRTFEPGRLQYADQLMARLGEELAPIGEQGLDLAVTDDDLSWTEGELFSLRGDRLGAGVQVAAPMAEETFLYTSQLYPVAGTVLGADVRGFVFLDHGYWPHGRDWKESRVFTDIQVGWEVFANEYADGTIEWGHLCRGTGGNFTFAIAHDQDGLIARSTDVDVRMDLDDASYVPRATFAFGGDVWEWRGHEKGQLKQFNNARWGGYRAQLGDTRRRGEERELAHGFSWLECFADRIRSDEIEPVDEPVSAGVGSNI